MSDTSFHGRSVPALDTKHHSSEETVTWVHHWNKELVSFRIPRPPDFIFVPGQHTRIGLQLENGTEMWRPYSIASAPHQKFLEFFLVTSRGEFSRRVSEFRIGSRVLLEHMPQGELSIERLHQPLLGQDLWLLATGTGLSPFISVLRDATAFWRFENIVLVVSVRESSDLGYAEELDRIAAAHANEQNRRFHYLRTFTRVQERGAAYGRVNMLLESGTLEKSFELPIMASRSRFMLSGNPEMITGVSDLLKKRGLRLHRPTEAGHIIVENYW